MLRGGAQAALAWTKTIAYGGEQSLTALARELREEGGIQRLGCAF